MLDELARAARATVKDVGPSIVRLGDRHRGAAAIVVSGRRLITNAHNVEGDAVTIRTSSGTSLDARVAGIDEDLDLAVLEVEEAGPACHITEEPCVAGSPVFAIGVGQSGPRVTFGLISSTGVALRGPRGRRMSGLVEHTAHLAPGSSGSALVDMQGRLVGMNTSRLGRGFYAAIPVDESLMAQVEKLATGESVQRPRLGVSIAPSWVAQKLRASVGLASREGLLVREVESDSAASEAGLHVGDLLLAVDGRPLADPEDLADVIDAAPGSMEIALLRGEAELIIRVELHTR